MICVWTLAITPEMLCRVEEVFESKGHGSCD
jgi:hypothetical protein